MKLRNAVERPPARRCPTHLHNRICEPFLKESFVCGVSLREAVPQKCVAHASQFREVVGSKARVVTLPSGSVSVTGRPAAYAIVVLLPSASVIPVTWPSALPSNESRLYRPAAFKPSD
jgi:hypothetical protein